MPRRPPVAVLAALLAASCYYGDQSPGPLPLPPQASGPAVTVCESVVAALPSTLAGQKRRATEPASTTTAAWGNPPITLVCGVPAGSALDEPYDFDGVRWAMHDVGDARSWTTLGRHVNVVVTIHDKYDGQAELLGSLASALSPTR